MLGFNPRAAADRHPKRARAESRLREWTHLRLCLGVRQQAELGGGTARNRSYFTPRLEAGEIGPVAPGQRTAQPHARLIAASWTMLIARS